MQIAQGKLFHNPSGNQALLLRRHSSPSQRHSHPDTTEASVFFPRGLGLAVPD